MTAHDDTGPPSRVPPPRTSPRRPVALYACGNAHAFFFPHAVCPRCAAPLHETDSPPDAVLVSHTTVRVGPGVTPFRLCLVRVACGAQTLCIMDGDPGERPESQVVIEKRGELYHAIPKASP